MSPEHRRQFGGQTESRLNGWGLNVPSVVTLSQSDRGANGISQDDAGLLITPSKEKAADEWEGGKQEDGGSDAEVL